MNQLRTASALAATGIVATGIVAAGMLVSAGVAPAVAADRQPNGPVSAAVGADHDAIAAYWTPARMRQALPSDQVAQRAVARAKSGKAAAGTAAKPTTGRYAGIDGTAPRVGGRSVAPIAHVGKVFYTLKGKDYTCSGNVVASANKDLVATAGHCVNAGPGEYATNWQFVPAYQDGAAPHGEWTARKLTTTSQWAKVGDISFDTGFALLNPLNGKHAADVVGTSGVAFNGARGQAYTLYGYPTEPPYDGEKLETCAGKAKNDPTGATTSQGVSCAMTEGASGGPWLLGSGSAGKQNSVSSFGYGVEPNVMYGPYWGNEIKAVYDQSAKG